MSPYPLLPDGMPSAVEAFPNSVRFVYTNWRGETRPRSVMPGVLFWSLGTKFHPDPQWLMGAWDNEAKHFRTFAMAMMRAWEDDPKDYAPYGDASTMPDFFDGLTVVDEGRVTILYENAAGVTRWRLITPISLRWSVGYERDVHHPQWVMSGWDHERDRLRVYAMGRLKKWNRDLVRGTK